MDYRLLYFSVSNYDDDYDCSDAVIFLHWDDFSMKVGNYKRLVSFRDEINKVIRGVETEYPKCAEEIVK